MIQKQRYNGNREQYHGHITWSQHGDDLMIASLFQLIGVEKGTYLDLGSNHPEDISNTALLYSKGWTGVNVDANPDTIGIFKSIRPNDKTINIGVGPRRGRMSLMRFGKTHGMNTFSYTERAKVPHMQVEDQVEVDVVTLNDVIEMFCDNKWPEFVNMDLEGLDFDTLLATEFPKESLPMVWCIEIRKDDSARFKSIMQNIGVGYFCICRMGENLIFVRNDLEGLVR